MRDHVKLSTFLSVVTSDLKTTNNELKQELKNGLRRKN